MVTDRRAASGIVIDLQPERDCGDCAMCEQYRRLNHAVGWYCGPVRQNPGEVVPGWKGEAIAGGMAVCRECHDGFYGLPVTARPPLTEPQGVCKRPFREVATND